MSEQNEKGFHLNHSTSPMKTYTRLISLQGSVSFKSISQRQRVNTKCNSSYQCCHSRYCGFSRGQFHSNFILLQPGVFTQQLVFIHFSCSKLAIRPKVYISQYLSYFLLRFDLVVANLCQLEAIMEMLTYFLTIFSTANLNSPPSFISLIVRRSLPPFMDKTSWKN